MIRVPFIRLLSVILLPLLVTPAASALDLLSDSVQEIRLVINAPRYVPDPVNPSQGRVYHAVSIRGVIHQLQAEQVTVRGNVRTTRFPSRPFRLSNRTLLNSMLSWELLDGTIAGWSLRYRLENNGSNPTDGRLVAVKRNREDREVPANLLQLVFESELQTSGILRQDATTFALTSYIIKGFHQLTIGYLGTFWASGAADYTQELRRFRVAGDLQQVVMLRRLALSANQIRIVPPDAL